MTEPRDPADEQTLSSWPAELTPVEGVPGDPALPPPPPTGTAPWGAPPPPSGQEPAPPWQPATPVGPGPGPYVYPGSYPPPGWAPLPGGPRAVPGAPGLEYAGSLVRIVAYFIDGILLTILALVVGLLLGIVAGVGALAAGGSASAASVWSSLLSQSVFLAMQAAYFTFGWSGSGRATPGMSLLGLQIGHVAGGHRLTRSQALKRWAAMGFWLTAFNVVPAVAGLASLVFFGWLLILLISTAASPVRQGLHDRFSFTAIVVESGRSNRGAIIGCLAIIGLVIGLFIVAMVALVFLGGQVSSILSEVGTSI